jgi:hypothetical protein
MPLVVNEISQSERDDDVEGVFLLQHPPNGVCMKIIGELIIENISRYDRREQVPNKNGDRTQYSNGHIDPSDRYGWSVSVAVPAAPL